MALLPAVACNPFERAKSFFKCVFLQVHDGFFNALFGRAQNKRSLRDGFSTNPETVFGAAFKAVTEVIADAPN